MSKEKTAVEWLYERLERMIPKTALYNIDKEQYFKEAKAMEKKQIIDAYYRIYSLVEMKMQNNTTTKPLKQD
jgi:hypothetical protein